MSQNNTQEINDGHNICGNIILGTEKRGGPLTQTRCQRNAGHLGQCATDYERTIMGMFGIFISKE